MAEKGLIVLSAGGTGGHVVPALALAAALHEKGYACAVATDTRGARFRSMAADVPFHVLSAAAPAGGLSDKIRGALALVRGTGQALALVRRLKPLAVVGFGGYPSVPAVVAGRILGVPVVLHEANAVLGRANRFLAPIAQTVALSHPAVSAPDGRTQVTGNPVRPEIAEIGRKPYQAPAPGGAFRIFVTGGSLGADVFGKVVPAALASLPEHLRPLLGVVQQCAADDAARVREVYARAGIQVWVEPFFTDLPDQIAAAHLVIARAGASTVAELAAAGRPSILVPYPHHGDRQQTANARTLVEAGGAWVMEQEGFTPPALRARIESLMQEPEKLQKAAAAARGCAMPDAAQKLAGLIASLVEKPAFCGMPSPRVG